MIINYTGTFKPFQKVAEWINHFDPLAKYLELDPYDTTVVRHGLAKKGSTISYASGDYCLYNNKIYRCIAKEITTNTSFNSSSWELVTNLFNELSQKPGIRVYTNTGKPTVILNPEANLNGTLYSLDNNDSYSSVIEGNDNRVGSYYCHAEGQRTYAGGYYAHTEGYQTTAGAYSHAEGQNTYAYAYGAHAEGEITRATASYSHAEGQYTYASGNASHAEGGYTYATQDGAHSEGRYTRALSTGAHAEGYYSSAYGYDGTHAEGYQTYSCGSASHSEGKYTVASNDGSHAEGYYSCAPGYTAHAEGYRCVAAGSQDHVEGYQSYSYGNYSHVEGQNNALYGGSNCHIEGGNNVMPPNTYSNCSHIEGYCNTGFGAEVHIEGMYNLGTGSYSHVGGYHSTGFGTYGIVHGEGCSTSNHWEFAVGKYNKSIDNGSSYPTYSSTSVYYYVQNRDDISQQKVKYDGKVYRITQSTPNPAGEFDPQYWTEIGTYEDHGTIFEIGNGSDAGHRSNVFEIYDDNTVKVNDHVVVTDVKVPDCPTTTDGNFALVCTVSNGAPTYQWKAINNDGTIDITPPTVTHGGFVEIPAGYYGYDTDPTDGHGFNWSNGGPGTCDGRCGIPGCTYEGYAVLADENGGHNEGPDEHGQYTPVPNWHDAATVEWTKTVSS